MSAARRAAWVEKTTQLSHRKHLEETWTVEISPPDYFTFENFPLTLEYPIHNNYIRYSLPHYGLDTTWEQVKQYPLNGTFIEPPTAIGPILTSEYVNTEEELDMVGNMIGCKSLFPIRNMGTNEQELRGQMKQELRGKMKARNQG